MTTMYVLTDTDNDPIGVFDAPDVPMSHIEKYYGKSSVFDFIDIDESGLQWQITIKTKDNKKHFLTMHYFTLNEI